MQLFLLMGLLAFALLGIAYLTWRFKSIARLRQTMGRPFAQLAHGCLAAAGACKQAYEKSRAWSETYVVVRLVYLFVALGIFLGDYSISRLRGATLMGMVVQTISWLPLENFAGLLWLLVPALIGSAAVELLGVVPAGWRLFTQVKQVPTLLRLALAGLTGLLFCVIQVKGAETRTHRPTRKNRYISMNRRHRGKFLTFSFSLWYFIRG